MELDGVSATCRAGCAAPLAGDTTAVLRLEGFDLTVDLTVDVDGVSAVVEGVAAVAGGSVDVSFTLPPTSVDAIQVTARAKTTLVSDTTVFAYTDVTYHRAPRLSAARFNVVGSQILLIFDQETTGVDTLACEAAIDTARLGASPKCTWIAPGTLVVALGSGAAILPDETVTFLGAGIRSANNASAPAGNSSATLERPARTETPKLLLFGPSEIGSCDSATLRVSAASPRPLTFRWGSSDASLDANLTAEVSPSLSLLGARLQPQVAYQITVQGVTFLGTASDVALHSLTVLDGAPPPLLSIAMPATPPLRTNTLWVSAIAKYSACAEDTTASLAYSWAVSRGGVYAEDSVVLTATGAEMQVPASTLLPGETYHVRLLGVLTSGASASASRIFTVARSSLLASIAGGATRTVSRTGTLTLDASNSADPDICPPPAELAGGFSGAVRP